MYHRHAPFNQIEADVKEAALVFSFHLCYTIQLLNKSFDVHLLELREIKDLAHLSQEKACFIQFCNHRLRDAPLNCGKMPSISYALELGPKDFNRVGVRL